MFVSMIILSLIILSRVKHAQRYAALALSFLVAIQMLGAVELVEEIERDALEEEVEIEWVLQINHERQIIEEPSGEQESKYITDAYNFSSIQRSITPSTTKERLYLLYQQIAYDKKA